MYTFEERFGDAAKDETARISLGESLFCKSHVNVCRCVHVCVAKEWKLERDGRYGAEGRSRFIKRAVIANHVLMRIT